VRLSEWCEARGKSLSYVMQETKLAYTTVLRARDGHCAYGSAKKISELTGGEVSIAELCERPEDVAAEDVEAAE
jgi:hypothetical protein